MSILKWLGLERSETPESSGGDAGAVRRIADALDRLEPDRARHNAAFA